MPGAPPRRAESRPWGLILALGGLAALLLPVLLIAIALFAFYTGDRLMPGTQVLGVDLGGKSRTEAVALLQQNWAARTVVLDAGDTTWAVSPAMLGLSLDAEATVQTAHQRGRSLAALKDVLKGDLQVVPAWRVAPAVAEGNLRALKPRFDVSPVDAGLRVVNGRVDATPAVPGRELDVAATAAWLGGNAEHVVRDGRLRLVMAPVQPEISDVSAVVDQANRLLAHSLAIRAYDPITDQRQRWEVAPEVWGEWLSLGVDPADPTRLDWALNPDQAQAFLSAQVATLGEDRRLDRDEVMAALQRAIETGGSEARVRVYHQERQHVVRPGETLSSIAYDYGIPYPWIQGANPGLRDDLSVGQVLTIPSPDVLLPLPVVENKRIVVSLSQQRMWAYENGALKWQWPVSTGISSSPTAPGVFQVQTHETNAYASNWNLWMPYFMGIYRPVPTSDFMNGFHGFPTRGGSTLLWTDDLGHPVTYGCILISTDNAVALYNWAEAGVVVEVRP